MKLTSSTKKHCGAREKYSEFSSPGEIFFNYIGRNITTANIETIAVEYPFFEKNIFESALKHSCFVRYLFNDSADHNLVLTPSTIYSSDQRSYFTLTFLAIL